MLCANDIIYSEIFSFYKIDLALNKIDYGFITTIIGSLIIAPIFETIIFQYLIHKGLKRIFFNRTEHSFRFVFILISASLFSISHWYSFLYILVTIIPGIILSWNFHWLYRHGNYKNAIYFTWLLHFAKNSLSVIDKYLHILP